MPVKVCHITTVHDLSDVRIFYKECRTLKEEGYEVYLVAKNNKDEKIDGINIVALKQTKSRLGRMFISTFSALRKALKTKAKLFHFHDPELIFTGIILRLLGKKVIYDVHEDVAAQILYKDWVGKKFFRRIISFIFSIIEKIGILFFNKVVAAEPETGKKFRKKKTVIIRNFPIYSLIDNVDEIAIRKNKPAIIYVGGLTRVRGIKELISAVQYVSHECELWLLGKWSDDNFKEECAELKGWKKTRYFGFKKPEEVYSYIKNADIGAALMHPYKNYLTNLPVKSFEYMTCKIPILMSNFEYYKKIYQDCALFADPLNPKEIAKSIDFLLENKEIKHKMAANGRKLIEKEYSWEAEKKILIKLYNYLLS